MSPMDFLKFVLVLALLGVVGYFYNNWAYRDSEDCDGAVGGGVD